MPRKKLLNRRQGLVISLRAGSLKYHATVSYTEEGELGEIFLTAGKTGTDGHTLARDLGIIASLLLQYGCPVEEMSSALTCRADGVPDGPLGILLEKLKKHK